MRRMRHLKPREIQGCDVAFQFWRPETLYDATSGGSLVGSAGSIARAEDVSGNGNHATQSASGARPTRQVAAQNGLDAARFDQTDDYLTAGDVADMLNNPVECYATFIRTGTAGRNVFGKSAASAASGRWNLSAFDAFLFAGSTAEGIEATLTSSANLQTLYGHDPRNTGVATIVRNAKTTATAARTDNGTSYNTAHILLVGAYQNFAGTDVLANTYLGGDIIECAKYSRNLGAQTRLRIQHAAMRRARIAG